MHQLDDILMTLAEPTRRSIVDLLSRGARRAGEIAGELDMSGPALSRHLRLLKKHGLVEELGDESDARVRVYSLRPEPFTELQDWLEEVAAFWSAQLDSFKQHAEAKKRKK